MLRRDDIRTGQHQLVTAAQCGAIHRRDDGFAELLKRSERGLRGVRGGACRFDVAGFTDF